jgi:flavorubredoxin
MINTLLENIIKTGTDKIDYIVSHHAEQDHSGSIADLLVLYPDAKVVTNPKCKAMLMDLLHIEEEEFIEVSDGQKMSLGDKTMQFVYTPWVHWPETMGTYLPEYKMYFSCDFFGSHLATSSLYVEKPSIVEGPAKRYYAEIMMPFRTAIKNNLKKLDELEIKLIAPSHGPLYDDPELIVNAYKDWVGDDVKNEVVLAHVSMHESTRRMSEHFISALMEKGIAVKPFNLTHADSGELAMAMVDAATISIASPTVLVGAHPKAAYAAILANALKPKARFATIFGSFGWGSKMVEQLTSLLPNLKAEIIEPVIIKGNPREQNFVELDELAGKIFDKHKEIGIVR